MKTLGLCKNLKHRILSLGRPRLVAIGKLLGETGLYYRVRSTAFPNRSSTLYISEIWLTFQILEVIWSRILCSIHDKVIAALLAWVVNHPCVWPLTLNTQKWNIWLLSPSWSLIHCISTFSSKMSSETAATHSFLAVNAPMIKVQVTLFEQYFRT